MAKNRASIPKAFWIRRLQSLMGFWLVLFLFEHLLTNSQAALFFGENGNGYVRMVNAIQELPYLHLIELLLIGVPFLIHMFYGIKVLKTSKMNAFNKNAESPIQPYGRNKAYSWQRITSWILLVGIIGHVVQMRFIDYPLSASTDKGTDYMVKVSVDKGLYVLSARLGVILFDPNKIHDIENKVSVLNEPAEPSISENEAYDPQTKKVIEKREAIEQQKIWVETLKKHPLKKGEVMAVSDSFGKASLLAVRETFKQPLFVALYTLLVLATCFHAFNGLWTFSISWGITISRHSQRLFLYVCYTLMAFVTLLGLSAIWGTYYLSFMD